jgi:hypothetical protein
MKQAAGKAIPKILKTSTRLPKYIIDLINTRRKMKRKLIKNEYKNKEMLSNFYLINKTIREEIKAVKNKNWSSIIEKTGGKTTIIESHLEKNSNHQK